MDPATLIPTPDALPVAWPWFQLLLIITLFLHMLVMNVMLGTAFIAFVRHFQGRVAHIIVWNEPNLAFEWGYRLPDPEAYVELLCQTYRLAKGVDSDVQILAAGLGQTREGQPDG